MPRPLSSDLRQRIVDYRKRYGATYEYIAEALGIGRATVSRVLRLHRETGSVEPKPATGGPARMLDDQAVEQLVALVEAHPDATLDELAVLWAVAHPELACSRQSIGRALHRADITRKKKPSARKSGSAKLSSRSGRSSSSG